LSRQTTDSPLPLLRCWELAREIVAPHRPGSRGAEGQVLSQRSLV